MTTHRVALRRRCAANRAEAQRGSVTAEFAAIIPAVLIVLAACLASLQVAGTQVRLQDATADAARALSRGDPEVTAAARLVAAIPGARLAVRRDGDLVCADTRARAVPTIAALSSLTVYASGCALGPAP